MYSLPLSISPSAWRPLPSLRPASHHWDGCRGKQMKQCIYIVCTCTMVMHLESVLPRAFHVCHVHKNIISELQLPRLLSQMVCHIKVIQVGIDTFPCHTTHMQTHNKMDGLVIKYHDITYNSTSSMRIHCKKCVWSYVYMYIDCGKCSVNPRDTVNSPQALRS